MPKYYTVKKIEISDNDKKSRYDDYLNEVKLGNLPTPAMSFDEYFNYDALFEEITMKCLECRHQEKFEDSHMQFLMEMTGTPFPFDQCLKCGMNAFMPLDVYRKIKGYTK